MNEHVDWNLLAKHLFGETSEEEEAELRAWVEEEPARRRALLDELQQVWETTDRPPTQWDVDALWSRVHEHMRRAPEPRPLRASERPPVSRRRRPARSAARSLLRLAAVLAVAAVTALLVVQLQGEAQPEAVAPEARVFATQRGEQATVRLTDGTHVRLNADSKLTLSPEFGSEVREVRLRGEAYFDVARDISRPFIVRAGQAATQVLGTEFDVKAYPDEERVRVVVAEGRVAFQPERAPAREGVVLAMRQMGELLRSGEQVVHEDVDLSQHLAWMEGQLVFEDAPLEEVAQTLERWYDLEVELREPAATPGHLNARFAEDQPLGEVLSVVATAFGLRYERDGSSVTFFPAQPPAP